MRLLRLGVLLAFVLVPLASGRIAFEPDSYILVDGPYAGVNTYSATGNVNGGGHVDAKGQIVGPDEDCDQLHFHGTIEGNPEPVGPCAWGRMIARKDATRLFANVAYSVGVEELILKEFRNDPDQVPHSALALTGRVHAELAKEGLEKAVNAGKIAGSAAKPIERRLDEIIRIDRKVDKQLRKKPPPADFPMIIREVKNALSLKRAAIELVMKAGLKVSDGADVTAPCEGARLERIASCTTTSFWDVNVPMKVKSAHCVAIDKTTHRATDSKHPLFPGVKQVQRCQVTNRFRVVGGVRKRIVHFEITLTDDAGTTRGKRPVRLSVYWPI